MNLLDTRITKKISTKNTLEFFMTESEIAKTITYLLQINY
jgi:hypothetical protein